MTKTTAGLGASRKQLYRKWWVNWWLMAAASLVTAAGLSVAMKPLIPEKFYRVWPWASTDDVLLVGVCVLLAAFIAYLSIQQREWRRRFDNLVEMSEQQATRHYRRLLALLDVSHMIGYQTDLQSIFDGITAACNDAFEAQWASLMLYEPENMRLLVASCSGDVTQNILGSSRGLGEGVAGWVAEHRRAILLNAANSPSEHPDLSLRYKFVGASMVAPILVDEALVGVISVANMEDAASFGEQDLQTLRVFAENIGVSVRQAQRATSPVLASHGEDDA